MYTHCSMYLLSRVVSIFGETQSCLLLPGMCQTLLFPLRFLSVISRGAFLRVSGITVVLACSPEQREKIPWLQTAGLRYSTCCLTVPCTIVPAYDDGAFTSLTVFWVCLFFFGNSPTPTDCNCAPPLLPPPLFRKSVKCGGLCMCRRRLHTYICRCRTAARSFSPCHTCSANCGGSVSLSSYR